MRLTPCLLAVVTLSSAPALVRADPPEESGPARTAPTRPPDLRDEAPATDQRALPDRPPPPPPDGRATPIPRQNYGAYPRPVPYRRGPPPVYYRRPRAYGWWGWGYAPILTPPPPPYAPGERPDRPDRAEADRVYTRINAYGAGKSDGYAAGLSLSLDSRYAGFDISIDALAREQVTGPLHDSGSDPAGWGSAHLTWSVLSTPNARLRVLTGASMLSLPDSRAVRGQPWAGKTLVGPDVGLSGQLGLAGPLGIEGYARLTPLPVVVADTYAGLIVHGGPLGVTAGWRWVDVQGSDTNNDAPKLMIRGPQVGLSLQF
jgi:hypothetical protein